MKTRRGGRNASGWRLMQAKPKISGIRQRSGRPIMASLSTFFLTERGVHRCGVGTQIVMVYRHTLARLCAQIRQTKHAPVLPVGYQATPS
jgi:hypothetical protein